ncbi:MAG: TRAP transporter large permease [Candidatus Limivicinus sp.]|jgi:tripartite ATP-independent transporter DctM subunit
MFDQHIAILILLGVFVVMICFKLPITFALAASSVLAAIYMKIPLMGIIQQMAKNINNFSLMAIPFFILAGEIMGAGGISKRMLQAANACVGHLRGGLAHVNVLASMLFGHLSGSAVADVSSLGSIEIPMMVDGGYDRDFAVATTVTSSCQGILIPPSHNMIIYSLAAGGVSVGALFMAGLVPGILCGVSLMIACGILSIRRNYPKGERMSWKKRGKVLLDAAYALFTAVIILVGVTAGWFTATESAAIAALYAFVVAKFIYKELSWKQIPKILYNVVKTLATVFSLIAAAGAFGWLLAYLQVPSLVTHALLTITKNKVVLLILINVLLLLLGCVMDMAPLIIIVTPILVPVVEAFGMSPVHFGVVLIFNLAVGLCTPPVGSALFVGCSVGKIKIENAVRAMVPLYIAMIICLILVTFVPSISLALPRLLGYNV